MKPPFSSRQASWPASLELFRYLGPGFFVTIGFIDPGNWVTNVVAGSQFGYRLLWVVTLSTAMLIIVQHNAAHLGIVTGRCLAEAAAQHFRPWLRLLMLGSALLACVATALAELLGAAIGLQMLFRLPLPLGVGLASGFALWMLFSKGYRSLEKWIIGFVSLIGLAFLFELSLAQISWRQAAAGWVLPVIPGGAMTTIMAVLGAVVMPHNIYLHSEVIQSRQWHREGSEMVEKQLRYEFLDTLTGMGVGWAINSAMIIMAAAVFYAHHLSVTELPQVAVTIRPIFGPAAAVVFGLGLVFAGLASSVTAAMAGGSIFAGIYNEPFDMADNHSRAGIVITLLGAVALILPLADPFTGILWSQVALSIQLPLTIIPLILLTSSPAVMGRFANPPATRALLWLTGLLVIGLNLLLLQEMLG